MQNPSSHIVLPRSWGLLSISKIGRDLSNRSRRTYQIKITLYVIPHYAPVHPYFVSFSSVIPVCIRLWFSLCLSPRDYHSTFNLTVQVDETTRGRRVDWQWGANGFIPTHVQHTFLSSPAGNIFWGHLTCTGVVKTWEVIFSAFTPSVEYNYGLFTFYSAVSDFVHYSFFPATTATEHNSQNIPWRFEEDFDEERTASAFGKKFETLSKFTHRLSFKAWRMGSPEYFWASITQRGAGFVSFDASR